MIWWVCMCVCSIFVHGLSQLQRHYMIYNKYNLSSYVCVLGVSKMIYRMCMYVLNVILCIGYRGNVRTLEPDRTQRQHTHKKTRTILRYIRFKFSIFIFLFVVLNIFVLHLRASLTRYAVCMYLCWCVACFCVLYIMCECVLVCFSLSILQMWGFSIVVVFLQYEKSNRLLLQLSYCRVTIAINYEYI